MANVGMLLDVLEKMRRQFGDEALIGHVVVPKGGREALCRSLPLIEGDDHPETLILTGVNIVELGSREHMWLIADGVPFLRYYMLDLEAPDVIQRLCHDAT